eukprot:gnl/Ergobibamus_cyprinoides/550.p2 GENE.gnl/Ergobibamus_cyprinoides/550~~gnl/Ergobibamus_cyprinoides/550.p2  ORF type:complete len:174 (+),score=30.75 gnl/Ergobibamus_cyprinoides/550:296-817(+)
MTNELFLLLLREYIIPGFARQREVNGDPADAAALLISDGHGSRNQPEVLRLLTEANISMFTLPPHTSHLTQPLDNSPFAILRRKVNDAERRITREMSPAEKTKSRSVALDSALCCMRAPDVILRSFATTGIRPFDPESFFAGKKCRTYMAQTEGVGSSRLRTDGAGLVSLRGR